MTKMRRSGTRNKSNYYLAFSCLFLSLRLIYRSLLTFVLPSSVPLVQRPVWACLCVLCLSTPLTCPLPQFILSFSMQMTLSSSCHKYRGIFLSSWPNATRRHGPPTRCISRSRDADHRGSFLLSTPPASIFPPPFIMTVDVHKAILYWSAPLCYC